MDSDGETLPAELDDVGLVTSDALVVLNRGPQRLDMPEPGGISAAFLPPPEFDLDLILHIMSL